MIRRVVAFTGTASPRPTPATAVLMPTTRARASASAPPELPGLSAASGWITSAPSRAADPLRVASDRPSALTTPAVTEPARPSGLPTATTSWPTTRSSASPSSAGAGVGPVARSTARSDRGSAPITRKGAVVPSENAAVPLSACPTTWALVSRNPSPVKTTPEPRLSPAPPRPRRGTRRLATLGVSFSATPETMSEYTSNGRSAAMDRLHVAVITVLQGNRAGRSQLPAGVMPMAESVAGGGGQLGAEPGVLHQLGAGRDHHQVAGHRVDAGAHGRGDLLAFAIEGQGDRVLAAGGGEPAQQQERDDHGGDPGDQGDAADQLGRVLAHGVEGADHDEHADPADARGDQGGQTPLPVAHSGPPRWAGGSRG